MPLRQHVFKLLGTAMMSLCSAACAQAPTQASPIEHQETVRVVSTVPETHPAFPISKRMLDAVMRKANLPFVLSVEPHERALMRFKSGYHDIEAFRIEQYDEFVPGVIRVDPHLFTVWYQAVGRDTHPTVTSWADLARYRIAYIQGVKGIEMNTRHVAHRTTPSTMEACVGMVAAQRVDLCVLNAELSAEVPRKIGDTQLFTKRFARLNLHMWVTPTRPDLARKLRDATRAMEASGELAEIAGPHRVP